MKNSVLSCCLLSLIFVAACSSEEPWVPDSQNRNEASSSYRVSLNQALERADQAFLWLDKENCQTRGKQRIRIPSKVTCLKSDISLKTRSVDEELPDTMIYIINYGDEDGFAIMSADSRTRPLYAISDEGHFDLADTINNKGLSIFLAHMGSDYMSSISGTTILPADSMIYDPSNDSIIAPINPGDGYGDMGEYHYVGIRPMLDETVQTWGGDDPFNVYCPEVSDTTGNTKIASAGCVAVAVGQMMSYYEWPKHYKDQTYDWDNMKSDRGSDTLARFLFELGKPENLDTDYRYEGGFSYHRNANRTFINLGYLVPKDWTDFSHQSVSSHLHRGGEPLLINAYAPVNGKTGGHAWIIDGFLQYAYEKPFSTEPLHWSNPIYHCVWGWQGASNGYYFFNEDQKIAIDMNNPYGTPNPKPHWMNDGFLFYRVTFLSGMKINPNYE